MELPPRVQRIRNVVGIRYWLWGAFLIYAQFQGTAWPDFKSKLMGSFIALAIFAFLPWLLFRPVRIKKAERKEKRRAAKEEREERVKQGLPARKPISRNEILLRIYRLGNFLLVAYYIYLVVTQYVPGVKKLVIEKAGTLTELKGTSFTSKVWNGLGQLMPSVWDYTVHIFRTESIGKVFLLIVLIGLIDRIIRVSLFIRKRRDRRNSLPESSPQ